MCSIVMLTWLLRGRTQHNHGVELASVKNGMITNALEVKRNNNHPVSLLFRMNDNAIHEIRYYEGLDEMLKHCLKGIPLSRVRYI